MIKPPPFTDEELRVIRSVACFDTPRDNMPLTWLLVQRLLATIAARDAWIRELEANQRTPGTVEGLRYTHPNEP